MDKQPSSVSPKYQMIVSGEERWVPIGEAGRLYDLGMIPVKIGGKVLEESGITRDITSEERGRIVEIADQWSEDQ